MDATGLLSAVITAASAPDRDAVRPLLRNLHRARGRIRLILAGAVCTGKLTARAATMTMTIQVAAKRNPHAFEVPPRRRAAERRFAWISRHRRTTRDHGRLPASREAMILRAMTALMTRRLARPPVQPGQQPHDPADQRSVRIPSGHEGHFRQRPSRPRPGGRVPVHPP